MPISTDKYRIQFLYGGRNVLFTDDTRKSWSFITNYRHRNHRKEIRNMCTMFKINRNEYDFLFVKEAYDQQRRPLKGYYSLWGRNKND